MESAFLGSGQNAKARKVKNTIAETVYESSLDKSRKPEEDKRG